MPTKTNSDWLKQLLLNLKALQKILSGVQRSTYYHRKYVTKLKPKQQFVDNDG